MTIYRIKKFSLTASLVVLVLGLFQPLPAAAEGDHELTFSSFGYSDRTATSMYGSLEYYFGIPQDWVLHEGSYLRLILSHSGLLKSDRSTVTVYVNDVAAQSAVLDETNAIRGQLVIPLPVESFSGSDARADGYTVRLQFYMRLTDLVCEEISNPAQWATVHEDSTLNLIVGSRTSANDLAELPYPLVVRNTKEDNQLVTFSFSSSPEIHELEAALQMAAYLGRHAPVPLEVRMDGEVDPNGSSVAFVGNSDSALLRGTGGFKIKQVPSDSYSLLVLGDEAASAVRALQPFSPLGIPSGTSWTLLRNPDLSLKPNTWAWKGDAATFEQLGSQERIVRGLGEQSTTFFFTRPAGWELTREEIYLDLHLSPSELMIETQSGARVSINGNEVGSIDFSEASSDGFYRLDLPAELLNVSPQAQHTQELVVEITLQHALPTNACEPTYAQGAWTVVHSDSYFYLPHKALPLPDVSTFPFPFAEPSYNEPVQIAMSLPPTEYELEAVLLIARSIGGRSHGPLPAFSVLAAGETAAPSGHLILIGVGERNALTAHVESQQSSREAGIQRMTASSPTIANLKAYASPWDQAALVLLLIGEGPGLPKGAEALGSSLPSGSVLAIHEDGTVQAIKRSVPAPTLPEPLNQSRSSLIPAPEPWHVAIAVLTVTLIAVGITIALARVRSARTGE